MSRKSIILCLIALAVMILGTGAAVAILYSGGETKKYGSQVADDDRYLLLSVVPSDAVAIARFSSAAETLPEFLGRLELQGDCGDFPCVISFHDSGKILPLFIFDAGHASELPSETAASLMEEARKKGYCVKYMDCSTSAAAGSRIAGHSIILLSDSETLLNSAARHIGGAVTIMELPGFIDASDAVSSDDLLFVSRSYAVKHMPELSRLADWMAFDIDAGSSHLALSGTAVYDGSSDFMAVLEKSVPAQSSVSEVLPSYTCFAVSLPLGDMNAYVKAYEAYLDSRQSLHGNHARQKALGSRMGINPYDFMKALDIREVAVASFIAGSRLESVLLIKPGTDELSILFKGTEVTSFRDYVPQIHSWPYASFVSSVFGNVFAIEDESCFSFVDGWIVAGSMAAVEEYVSGRAVEYTLDEYFSDASQSDLLAAAKSSFVAYFSCSGENEVLRDMLRPGHIKFISSVSGSADFAPAVITLSKGKNGLELNARLLSLAIERTKAPTFERDTVVNVPKGPFEVRNSGTGKMNRFYQNSHLSLCLSEDGRDLWGIPFKKPLCGTAYNIDYYANGKLQIIFGAGSSIYLVDRLGRYVKGFPIGLGKEILLGPDLYDFNGSHKYNILVLHTDNTVEMYNLKGQKPALWKGITSNETIKSLPERLMVGGKTFWVVRTSIQTLIFPFYGGEPLTVFEGDRMIRPDSDIKAADAFSIEYVCYDGKRRTTKLI